MIHNSHKMEWTAAVGVAHGKGAVTGRVVVKIFSTSLLMVGAC